MSSLRPLPKLCTLWVMTLGIGLWLLLAPNDVGAQARLLESTPTDGDSLLTLEDIRFEFDSLLLDDDVASVTVTRTNGEPFPAIDVFVEDTVLGARVLREVPTGTYEIGYAVRSSDGALNEGTLRVSVDAPSQALSGGLLAVVGIFAALFVVLFLVFLADKRRRPGRRRERSSG